MLLTLDAVGRWHLGAGGGGKSREKLGYVVGRLILSGKSWSSGLIFPKCIAFGLTGKGMAAIQSHQGGVVSERPAGQSKGKRS